MTNKELELIGQLTEVATIIAELKAENKILKDINDKLMQALKDVNEKLTQALHVGITKEEQAFKTNNTSIL